MLLVEHNLRLVRAVADRVIVMAAGAVIASGSPAGRRRRSRSPCRLSRQGRAVRRAPLLLSCSSSSCSPAAAAARNRRQTLLIAVDAPFSRSPYIGQTIARGVELAASEINVAGLATNDGTYNIKVKRYDNALSPRKALSNARRAIADGAVAIIDDGTGVDASWKIASDAQGPDLHHLRRRRWARRSRAAPERVPDRADESRHLVPSRRVHDPEGIEARADARRHDLRAAGRRRARQGVRAEPRSRSLRSSRCRRATDLSPQVLRARRAGATGAARLGPGVDDRGGRHRRAERRLGRPGLRASVAQRIPRYANSSQTGRTGSTA